MANSNRNRTSRVEFANTTETEMERRRRVLEDARRPRIGAPSGTSRPLEGQRASLPELLASRLPSGASRDLARMALHGLARTGNTILRAIDIPNRVFGNTRSLLQDIYERSEANLARDAYEDRSGIPQVGEAAVHLASAGVLGRALPAVFGANVGADTYETARYAGASEGEALATGVGHGVVDTAIWTLGQGLASKYLPKAWQWLGRELTGAMRGAASSVTSDAVLNSLGADISGEEMARRAVHAAWMVPLLGMLKMGGKRREEAMSLLRKARPDLAGEKADKVIETIEAEFSDPRSQKVALAWVARKGANLPDDTAQIRQALEVSSKVKGLDPMSRSPFEILSDPAYARYLPKPRPQDVKAFSNMKRYPMGVIGFDVSDDAAGRQATREMINAYMSPSSNPWCLATGKDAARLGELGPGAERYWNGHSAVPKQIFFQKVDGKLELTAFRATSPGGEGRQEYWDTSDAGYSGIPIKVKVPGDPMGRYRKMVFRPADSQAPIRVKLPMYSNGRYSDTDLRRMIAIGNNRLELERERPGQLTSEEIARQEQEIREARQGLAEIAETRKKLNSGEVQGTFEDIAPGKVFKGDPFRDGRSQTWAEAAPYRRPSDLSFWDTDDGRSDLYRDYLEGRVTRDETLRRLSEQLDAMDEFGDNRGLEHDIDLIKNMRVEDIEGVSTPEDWGSKGRYVLVEDKVRTTENGITKFRTTKYADPTDRDYEPPKPGEAPKPVEIEESELVSPEWMRSHGYDPESESDVRRMQQDLNIQGWGNGVEAAMAVVPTKRTYMQTKSGTPETVTYGPNGRDVVSVDFEENGVPYREVYGTAADKPVPTEILNAIDAYDMPLAGFTRAHGATGNTWLRPIDRGFRLVRNPDSESPEALDEIKWDEGLGSFVRTSGDRRWRMTDAPDLSEARRGSELHSRYTDAIRSFQDADVRFADNLTDESLEQMRLQTFDAMAMARREYLTWAEQHPTLVDPYNKTPIQPQPQPQLLIEDRQPDGTWAPAVDRVVNAESDGTGIGVGHAISEIAGPFDIEVGREGGQFPTIEAALAALQRLDSRPPLNDFEATPDEIIEDREYYNAYRQALVQAIEGAVRNSRRDEAGPSRANTLPPPPDEIPLQAEQGLDMNDVPFALKAGRTRRNIRAAEGGGDAGSETAVSETPVSEAPQNPGGPRIVINPQVFNDKRDALCVAFNEAFRVVMEMNGFEPASEPTEAQRKFFSDTAYADDELQLRRTILARIATLDTSVKDPTDEQLEETAEMLEMVMEVGAPQNEWEQSAVKRLHDVVVKSLESTRANGTANPSRAEPPDMV